MGPAEQLRKKGHSVEQFSTYHFLVGGRIEFWLPRGKWHDRETGERGQKPLDQLALFISRRLEEPCSAPK